MTVHSIHPTRIPTPAEVLDAVVEQFAPKQDPANPFIDHTLFARRKLATLMFVHAFGHDSPISKLTKLFMLLDRDLTGNTQRRTSYLELMQEAWEEVENAIKLEIAEQSEG